jgi:DNA-binding NtrC family response regulator
MLTLLLVDDDAVVLDLLTRLLGRYFDVITCESAEMALRVIEE